MAEQEREPLVLLLQRQVAIQAKQILALKAGHENQRDLHAEITSLQTALTKMYELAKERNNTPMDVLSKAEIIIMEARHELLYKQHKQSGE